MTIFEVHDLRIPSLVIVADDVAHATHLFLDALHGGLGYWPKGITYGISEYEPPEDQHPEILRDMAAKHTGGFAHFDEGWEINRPASADNYDPTDRW